MFWLHRYHNQRANKGVKDGDNSSSHGDSSSSSQGNNSHSSSSWAMKATAITTTVAMATAAAGERWRQQQQLTSNKGSSSSSNKSGGSYNDSSSRSWVMNNTNWGTREPGGQGRAVDANEKPGGMDGVCEWGGRRKKARQAQMRGKQLGKSPPPPHFSLPTPPFHYLAKCTPHQLMCMPILRGCREQGMNLWVFGLPWVSYDTTRFMGWCVPIPATGMVSVGSGTVCENPTCGLPVLNPTGDCSSPVIMLMRTKYCVPQEGATCGCVSHCDSPCLKTFACNKIIIIWLCTKVNQFSLILI